jgi:hypothetical protein
MSNDSREATRILLRYRTRYAPELAAKTSFNNRCCTTERRPDGTAICPLLFVLDLLPVPDDLLSDDLLDGTAISSLLLVDLLTLVPDDLVPEALLLLLEDSAMVDRKE